MIKFSINLDKIPKGRSKQFKSGRYLDFVMVENKDGQDQYGNEFFIRLDTTKEEREQGLKLPIVGNGKYIGQKAATRPAQAPPAARPEPPADPDLDADADDDIPF